MAFRGYFALNNVEIANSSRASAHLGRDIPTLDSAVFGSPEDCGLTVTDGLASIPSSSEQISSGLYTPPNGARRFGPGLYEVGDCWGPAAVCSNCSATVPYDDSWPGLAELLDDGIYRPELAPWYTVELPESGEFGGVWVMSVEGLDTTPVDRAVTQTVDDGGVAAPHRDSARTLVFNALLFACTNAGLQYGLNWLTCLLRSTKDDTARLKYLNAHPSRSSVDPSSLIRELHNVVLTESPTVTDAMVTGSGANQQATMYRITWEMVALNPHAYLPPVKVDVQWDSITRQPINWIHAADCKRPETCEDMPVMFSTECEPEFIEAVSTPPPVCGGCMPVDSIDVYSFQVPTQDYAFRCRDTAVSMEIRNIGASSLTLQSFWRVCGTDIRCEDHQYPLQVSGLPPGAVLTLDGISERYWAYHDERIRRPVGVVGTPNGAPWRAPVVDRQICWDLVVHTASTSEFEMSLTLADREP